MSRALLNMSLAALETSYLEIGGWTVDRFLATMRRVINMSMNVLVKLSPRIALVFQGSCGVWTHLQVHAWVSARMSTLVLSSGKYFDS